MKKLLILVSMLVLLITACAPGAEVEINTPEQTLQLRTPGPNPELNAEDANGRVSGVLDGLWHGLIAPVTAIGSFFNPDMQMYEVHNNGREYNLGFLVGVALIFLFLGVLGGRGRRRV